MRMALALARKGVGLTSPNPMVGAVLVQKGRVIGKGWHRRAGEPHAEIEALRDAARLGHRPAGATLYVTLEPCCTHGRTPPCSGAIIQAKIRKVVIGVTDPNPRHRGRGGAILGKAGIEVTEGVLASQCRSLNEAFNHWIVHRTPLVTVKAAMTLDGKIATASGESKWITGAQARSWGMRLRGAADAVLVGINTVLADDPSLTFRPTQSRATSSKHRLRRVILDSTARLPLEAKVASDSSARDTILIVSKLAPRSRVHALSKHVQVLEAPLAKGSPGKLGRLDLDWVLKELGRMEITHVLVEGGGEVNASFLLGGLAHRIAFFYAPKVLGGRQSKPGVGGIGATSLSETISLKDIRWRRLGRDWLLTASV